MTPHTPEGTVGRGWRDYLKMKRVKCKGCGVEFGKTTKEIRKTREHFHSLECCNRYKMSIAESRFFTNIKIDSNGCWNWRGAKNGIYILVLHYDL